ILAATAAACQQATNRPTDPPTHRLTSKSITSTISWWGRGIGGGGGQETLRAL
uniref:Envelope glycoprotein n=1 Tax=Mesocestoides corti TaxID=53468 RepID=A0A5K3FK68_MESCO